MDRPGIQILRTSERFYYYSVDCSEGLNHYIGCANVKA